MYPNFYLCCFCLLKRFLNAANEYDIFWPWHCNRHAPGVREYAKVTALHFVDTADRLGDSHGLECKYSCGRDLWWPAAPVFVLMVVEEWKTPEGSSCCFGAICEEAPPRKGSWRNEGSALMMQQASFLYRSRRSVRSWLEVSVVLHQNGSEAFPIKCSLGTISLNPVPTLSTGFSFQSILSSSVVRRGWSSSVSILVTNLRAKLLYQ